MNRFRVRAGTAGLVLLALAATSCGSGKATGGSAQTGSDGVKQGPGVTDDTISVGMISDLTGPYAPLGKSITQGSQLYFEQVNAAGGICGRKVEPLVRDMGYDVQKSVTAYTELAPKSAAFAHFIGSVTVGAVRQRLDTDGPLTLALAWAPSLLGSKSIQMTGTTYAIDVINGVDYLAKEKGLKSGDKIGHVYVEGDYGIDSLAGSKYAAEKLGFQVVEQKVKATDADMSGQVAVMKDAGVKAVVLSISPKQTASMVGVAVSKGLNVPFLGSNSSFAPQLLATPAAPALLKGFHVMQSASPLNSDLPAMKKLVADYRAKYPKDTLDNGVMAGYTTAAITGDALKKACANKDLTRQGIISAHRSTSAWDGGFGTTMDFTKIDEPPTRTTHILQPDKTAVGGLKIVREATASDLANGYKIALH
ncbi:ABC-type branched-chain amino acid transport system, substrate-binding protein [Thermomonospora echinospora]|uniref:ABC-type branched-chain amino acid transport system, substrate-binding protein n=1 Tax=Thermomonospora echinospora TaxID=1992 RepID=A0A1H6E3N4_9ACTN|nr:ABC transporter substrate-binding protein [Thermomonospora echinospora]SEG91505.1 ABC-type branched-chain amino acid transport system, substrate-binding protein [Thermomonospora echinospora]